MGTDKNMQNQQGKQDQNRQQQGQGGAQKGGQQSGQSGGRTNVNPDIGNSSHGGMRGNS